MIEGIGIDLVEKNRIKEVFSRQPAFAERILTEGELALFATMSSHRQIEFLAGRFAAKEAFSKAMGTGIGADVSFLDVEILPDEKNKPMVRTAVYTGRVHVSISHAREYIIAQIILEK